MPSEALAKDGGAPAENSETSPGGPAVAEESVEDIIKKANQQKVECLNLAKEKIKTPEGRAEIEPVAKANGFQTP